MTRRPPSATHFPYTTLFRSEEATLAPGETRELSASLPDCAYQTDAFCGTVIRSFHGGVRYGDRLFDDVEGGGRYCQPGTPPPPTYTATQTPAATHTSTATGTSIRTAVLTNTVTRTGTPTITPTIN